MDIILTSILKGKMGRERKTRNQSYSYFLKTKTQSFCLAKGRIGVIGAHDLLSRMPHNNVYIYIYRYIYIYICGGLWVNISQLTWVKRRCPAQPHPRRIAATKRHVSHPNTTAAPPASSPPDRLTNHSHWHFRGRCGSKIVRISPNQLSSHSCHTTHCPWTRTYPRLRLGGGDRLEEIATQEVKLTKRYTT